MHAQSLLPMPAPLRDVTLLGEQDSRIRLGQSVSNLAGIRYDGTHRLPLLTEMVLA